MHERLLHWYAAGWSRKGKDGELHWQSAGDSVASFWDDVDYALKRGGATWLVAWHVLRHMAVLKLWEYLEDGDVRLDCVGGMRVAMPTLQKVHGSTGAAVIEDPPTILRIKRGDYPGSLIILDARNWGFPEPDGESDGSEVARRALECVRSLSALIHDSGWGSMALTSGAQAWRTWRTTYAQHPVQVHCHPVALEIEGAAYYGGRCEARYIGDVSAPVWHVDFRSLYGWIAASLDLPALLCDVTTGLPNGRSGEEPGSYGRIAEVQLSTSEPAYPFRRDGETYWPVGTFWTTLAGPELEDARERGRILRYGRMSTYRLSPCLAGFADAVWRALVTSRSVADDGLSGAIKRLLLCLPGRCGQRGSRWVPDDRRGAVKQWGEWWDYDGVGGLTRYRALAGVVEREVRETWAPEAIPAVAAWITSAGRVALLNAIRQAGWENVLYHDTDSLIVTDRGWQLLWLGGQIKHDTFGALRLLSMARQCDIRGIKDYTLDGARTCAGLPKGAHLPSGLPDHYWYGVHARGALQQQRRPEAELQLKAYTRERAYHHGVVGKDGWVKPLEVNE